MRVGTWAQGLVFCMPAETKRSEEEEEEEEVGNKE